MFLSQASLFKMNILKGVIDDFSEGGIEERGAVYTKREVVDFILDLAGYTSNRKLFEFSILEPSFGGGDFLLPIVERLLSSLAHAGMSLAQPPACLTEAVRAVELHKASFLATRRRLAAVLSAAGVAGPQAQALCDAWLRRGDFLLEDVGTGFAFVVGNPPYVRQERIPDALLEVYRRQYVTIFDRADLYIPFIEKSLACSSPAARSPSSAPIAG
jgi:hypothetical protein